ncbi:hypothetical protein [Paraferrimonas sp. SM1919]|uniref:hypothetical protein n=1 Tax=Paraferrimonas sp. SM1919 TaxID=2662263 RepID=UPI0013D0C1FD|nr:hypothetical protein [Paraferrimonas sp. SM1919]
MNHLISKVFLLLFTVSLAQPVMANCESQVKAAERAAQARDRACNAASKSWKDKTADEMKNANKRCEQKQKAYERAKERLRACHGK